MFLWRRAQSQSSVNWRSLSDVSPVAPTSTGAITPSITFCCQQALLSRYSYYWFIWRQNKHFFASRLSPARHIAGTPKVNWNHPHLSEKTTQESNFLRSLPRSTPERQCLHCTLEWLTVVPKPSWIGVCGLINQQCSLLQHSLAGWVRRQRALLQFWHAGRGWATFSQCCCRWRGPQKHSHSDWRRNFIDDPTEAKKQSMTQRSQDLLSSLPQIVRWHSKVS